MVVDETKRVNATQAYTNERVHTQLSVRANEVVSAIEIVGVIETVSAVSTDMVVDMLSFASHRHEQGCRCDANGRVDANDGIHATIERQ